MKTIKINDSEFEVIEMQDMNAGDFDEIISEITDANGVDSKRISPWLRVLIKKWTKDGKVQLINSETTKKIKLSEAVEIMKELRILGENEIQSLENLFKKKETTGQK